MNIKKNDTVVVISGKDKGSEGQVIACYPKLNRVTVQNVNQVKRHRRPTQQQQGGQIVTMEMPMEASNVMVKCPKCGKPTRVGHKVTFVTNDEGKQVRKMIRVCKKCGADID